MEGTDEDSRQLIRPSRFAIASYKLRFYASWILYPMRRLWHRLRRNGYMLATLSGVNVEMMASLPGMNTALLAAFKPPLRQMPYPRLKSLRQLPIRSARDFLHEFKLARMLIVDITPTQFSGASMDSRIALLIGMAVAKSMPVYYIRAENIKPFIERQRSCMQVPHKSALVQNPDSVDFSNLADLIEEC